jgi:hypothetical protein
MDLWDVATVMWRRRGVTVPLLLLSVIAAVFALLTIPPAYSAKAQIAFLAPAGAQPGLVNNPFTAGSLAEYLSITLNRQEIRQQVGQDGVSAGYVVTFKSEGLPVLGLEVVGREKEAVAGTVARLIGLVESEAAKLQTNVGSGQAIAVSVADRGDDIRVVRAAGRRALVVIAGVGLFATAGVALSVDALIRRRSRGPEPPQRRLVPRQSVVVAEPVRRLGSAQRTESVAVGAAATGDAAGRALARRAEAARAAAAGDAEVRVAAEQDAPAREASESEAGERESDAANAVTVLLDQASSESLGDTDVTVVMPLAGVSRPNGKQSKGPLGKRVSGDAPGGAKKR